MSLPLPTSLSPSKVSSFKDCALAFRFAAIDRLPEPPSPHAVKGTLVHRALELLVLEEAAGARTPAAALDKLAGARVEAASDPEFVGLGLSEEDEEAFFADAASLVGNYFQLEDPNGVRALGTEMWLSVQVGTLTLRGIIDRLEVDDAGGLVVTDYKTGRAPSANYEQPRLGGVHFYAFLCEEVLGERPARIQLLHLREPIAISTTPSSQSLRGSRQQTMAVWDAVERACEREDFRPKPSRACDYCAFHAYCPVFGGDPDLAAAIAATLASGDQLPDLAGAHSPDPTGAPSSGPVGGPSGPAGSPCPDPTGAQQSDPNVALGPTTDALSNPLGSGALPLAVVS